MKKHQKCCICGAPLEGYGNNPQGAAFKTQSGEIVLPDFKDNDRCCDACDAMYVIPGRMYRIALARKKQ